MVIRVVFFDFDEKLEFLVSSNKNKNKTKLIPFEFPGRNIDIKIRPVVSKPIGDRKKSL